MQKLSRIILILTVTSLAVAITARSWRSSRDTSSGSSPAPGAERGSLPRFANDASGDHKGGESAAVTLTASDGTGLTLAAFDSRGVIEGPLGFTEVRLAFDNPEDRTLEGTFRITLPQGAAISRFAMRQGDHWQEGEVVEKQAARRAYEDFLHRRQDPALLEQAAGNEFSARVFPIPPRGRKELIVSYSQELGPEAPYVVLLRGLPRVAKLDAVVARSGDDAPFLGQVHLEGAAPDRDLVVDAARLALGDGVRAGDLALLRVIPAGQTGADPVRSAVVLIDTSASRSLGYDAEIDLVDRVLGRLDPSTKILVAAFDQGIDVIHEGAASAWAPGGAARLRERAAMGASDLGAAIEWARARAPSIQATRVILVSDGVPTRGITEPPALQKVVKTLSSAGVLRVDALAVGGIRDDALLRSIVTAGLARDGVVIEGARGSEVAYRRLSSATRSVSVKVEGAKWSWPDRVDGVQPGDEALIFAELTPGSAPRVTLGDSETRSPKLTTVDRPLLERAFIKAKIAELVASPGKAGGEAAARAEIVRLSTTHRVLSPHTALLVLETEADYERYKIDRKALSDILTVEGTRLAHLKRRDAPMMGAAPAASAPGTSDGVVLRPPPARTRGDLPSEEPAPSAMAQATAAPAGGTPGAAPARAADPMSARGNMWGDEIGDSFGAGGLGLSGVGEGGGGRAEAQEFGMIGTLGHGAGTGSGQGFGSGHGRLGGSHRASPPTVRMGATTVNGRLPPEVIQRIVRQNFGRFRLCYENGLRNNPNLQGRVSVRFVIGADGAVSNVANAGSDLPDAAATACVIRAFVGLSFPQPEGGIVTVTYPILFAPGGGPLPPGSAMPAPDRPVARPSTPPPPPPPPPKPAFGPYEGKLAEVMEALASGDKDGALSKATTFWKASPGDVTALVAMGEAFEARGELRGAARAYGSIIDLFSSRADLRRMAGERLERLSVDYAHELAADSYEKAAAQRPDHPASHRLLAYARLRAGNPAGALDAIEAGVKRRYPEGRFAGVPRILAEDMGLIAAALLKAHPEKKEEVLSRLATAGATLATTPSLRFVLVWETDSNDVDFHIHDAAGGHAFYSHKELPSGGALYADVTTGYGPECFTVPLPRERRAGPYRLQAHYYSRGPMGYGMGKLSILDHDGAGGLTFEERPFVVMKDRAFVELGSYPAKAPVEKK